MVIKHRFYYIFAPVLLIALYLALTGPGCGERDLGNKLLSDCVEIPPDSLDVPTAGLIGVRLTVETRCVFQIDMSSSRPLRWCRFVLKFPTAYVRMKVTIDETGRVASIFDTKDDGQPAALEQIRRAVREWKYEGGCLEGDIYMEFNASMSRLTFDDSRMRKVPGYEHCDIIQNRMHAVRRQCNLGVFRRALDW